MDAQVTVNAAVAIETIVRAKLELPNLAKFSH
jgi:hypothetical protein